MLRAAIAALALSLAPSAAGANERATTKEAEAMVHSAVAFLQKEGTQKAMAAFNDPKGPFTYRDLYIVVVDFRGVIRAHLRPDIVGKNRWDTQDPDGKYINRSLIEVAKTSGKGWVEYKYKNPDTGRVEQKVSYVERVGDIAVSCGAYLRAG